MKSNRRGRRTGRWHIWVSMPCVRVINEVFADAVFICLLQLLIVGNQVDSKEDAIG